MTTAVLLPAVVAGPVSKIDVVAELKDRLRADLNAAMRARDQVRMRTLRMALASITNEEVAGAAARDLSDDEIVRVLTREARKRKEAAEAFSAAGRDGQAAAERAEGEVLAGYLPAQLSDDELAALVATAIAETGASGMASMGLVMRTVTPRIAGRADGARVAAEVRRRRRRGPRLCGDYRAELVHPAQVRDPHPAAGRRAAARAAHL